MKKLSLIFIVGTMLVVTACGEGSKPPKYRSNATPIEIETFTTKEAKDMITIDYTFCRFALNEEDAEKGKYIYVDNGDDSGTEAVLKIFGKMIVFNLSHNDNGTITGESVPDETGTSRFRLEIKKGEHINEGGHGFSIYKGELKLENAYNKDLIQIFYGECGGGGIK